MKKTMTNDIAYQWVKLIVYANAGWGKTLMLGTLPEENTLIVNLEKGLLTLQDRNFMSLDPDDGQLKANLDGIILAAKNNATFCEVDFSKIEYICLDSITRLSKRIIDLLRTNPKYADPKNSMLLWGDFTTVVGKLIRDFISLDKHVIFTALVDESSSTRMPMMDGAKEQASLVGYFDEIFYGTQDESGLRKVYTSPLPAFAAKDRSGKLPKIIALKDEEKFDLVKVISRILNKEVK